MNRSWLTLTALLAVAACENTTGIEDAAVQAGALQVSGWNGFAPEDSRGGNDLSLVWDRPPAAGDIVAPKVIEAPDTVTAGAPFEVTTYTVAPDGCWSAAGQDVTVSGRVLQLRPLDRHSGAAVCTTMLSFPAHTSRVVLNERGSWTARVSGRRVAWDGRTIDRMVTVEKTIIVR